MFLPIGGHIYFPLFSIGLILGIFGIGSLIDFSSNEEKTIKKKYMDMKKHPLYTQYGLSISNKDFQKKEDAIDAFEDWLKNQNHDSKN
tara:strand:- start:805 stop:1068 length:264 start_codon:yes stop_codon:yes gene_type:complete